ncbi:ABC transporter substrate-binding protein [Hungatella sp.]|uniref:ABC transporter substrate-binding protein n=1 Tax=Hungatella sp. TaxID=2613924 RepID=UPI002A83BC1C|nr:ABC transporter substrate-binding protein [Hungatella sp.]
MKHFSKKVTACAVSLAVLSGLMTGCSGSDSGSVSTEKQASSEESLLLWTFSPDDLKQDVIDYEAKTGVKVEVVGLPWNDYQTKLMQAARSGEGMPDIFVVDNSFAKKWIENDNIGMNFSKEYPDFVKKYEEDYYDVMIEVGRDSAGDLRGVTLQYPIGMLYYQRDIAKEVLGSDDPEVVAEATNSVEKLIALGDKITETYGGERKLAGNETEFTTTYLSVRPEPYVKDGKIIINDYITGLFDIDKEMYEKGMFASENGGDACITSMTAGTHFLDFSPTWGYALNLKNAIAGTEMEGRWGVTSPTWSNYRGGSWFQVYKNSAKKDQAIAFLEFLLFDEDTIYKNILDRGDFTSNKKVAKRLVESGYEDPVLGNQQLYAAFQKEAERTEVNNVDTVYDDEAKNRLTDALKSYKTGALTLEEALEEYKAALKNAYPELTE